MATQQTQRRESTFLTLLPYSEGKAMATAAASIDEANAPAPASEVIPTMKTQRSTSESSTSSQSSTRGESKNRFLRLGHAVREE